MILENVLNTTLLCAHILNLHFHELKFYQFYFIIKPLLYYFSILQLIYIKFNIYNYYKTLYTNRIYIYRINLEKNYKIQIRIILKKYILIIEF